MRKNLDNLRNLQFFQKCNEKNFRMVRKRENNIGITLISLVITIIVLLILAGVTIAALNGDNGILKRASSTKDITQKQGIIEEVRVDILEKQVANETGKITSTNLKEILEQYFDGVPDADEIKPETILKTKSQYGNYTLKVSDMYEENVNETLKYIPYRDTNNEKVPVPEGFTVSTKAGENTVKEGIVIVDEKGNEYVWIPCTTDSTSDKLKFERTKWDVEDDNNTIAFKDELTLNKENIAYTDQDLQNGINSNIVKEIVKQIEKEKASVQKYGGYYIGRYEVGKEDQEAVIKANKEPYVNLTWKDAYDISKKIGGGSGAMTYLCSSYAWDTAINFIQKNGAKDYPIKISGFNGNWDSEEVKTVDGTVIKPVDTSKTLNTGLTSSQSNIYDMGGNVGEFTTEINPGTGESLILRGGDHDSIYPAGYRWDVGASVNTEYKGFRITLFLN